jgi:uncharacterized protein
MKDLITRIAQALVDQPDKVQVNEISGNQTSVLELKVAKDDLRKSYWKTGSNR